MRNLIILLLSIFVLSSCTKKQGSISITISPWEQSSSVRYGYYDSSDKFNYCTRLAPSEVLDSVYNYDTLTFISYTEEGFEIVIDTTHQDFQIFVQVYNGTYRSTKYYDVLYVIVFKDGSTTEIQFNGAGIQSGYSANDQFCIHAKGKEIETIFWSNYTFDQ